MFGWVGLVTALGIFVGVLEEAGFTPAARINALSYVAWSLWLVAPASRSCSCRA